MSTLVGDLIMNVRSLGPDNPSTTTAPVLLSLTPTTGGILTAGTYIVVVTGLTPWGESLPSSEFSVVLAGPNNAISVSVFLPAGTISCRAYFSSAASGSESSYIPFSVGYGTQTLLITTATSTSIIAGFPPVRSSSYLPDTDGAFVSAATMYRWLNDALRAAARITNGIQDVMGIASISGNRRYTAPGQWLRFDQCFYDGWELDLGNKAETFRNRNLTANISLQLMVDAQSDSTRIELYWTPGRTSGSAITTFAMLANATSIAITTPTGWLLQDGFALLTDNVNTEIISYSQQTFNALQGCIRGWAGTQAYPFAPGTSVRELNIEINGYRMPATYSVGNAALTLGVPPGWEPFLKDYMLGTFREAEQEAQEAQGLKDRAAKGLEAWVKSNKPVAGPRQMRMHGDYGLRGTVPGGLTGPLIIP